ncbi:MAG TPA: hypothetical protein DEP13_08045 [Gammaproteobacteria bacterium]|nr:MAG: hypothetical protein CBD74_05975 [Saprospirales bacterium TMED214]HCA36575.1 hypothetical protein [Gammaproteobacteria bacterium]
MAVFNKLNGFVEHLAEGVHNLGSDQLALALSNVAPSAESTAPTSSTANCILSNVTEINYTGLSSRNVTTSSAAQSSGTYRLTLSDLTLSSTGTVGPFRYIYLYNDSATSPADPLIGYFDYGANLTLNNGESLTIDFDQASGALTLS